MPRHPFALQTLVATSIALATILGTSSASAQKVELGRTQMMRSMEDYFEGERAAGYVFFGHGLVSVGTGLFLFTRKDDMSRGAAYPPMVVGVLETSVGLGLMMRTSKQIAERRQQITNNPEKFRQEEEKRMKRVIGQFVFLEVVEIGAIATGIGLVTAGQIKDRPTLTGVGAGLVVEGASILGLDFLAERRGQHYLKAIVDFQPSVARDGFGVSVRGVF